MSERIVFSSIGEAQAALADFPERMKVAAEQALYEAAEFMVMMAKSYCPVDTGTLQGSIRMEVTERGVSVKAGGLQYINPKTGRPCTYAVYVESRTPFMRPAWESIKPLVTRLLKERVRQLEH